MDLAALNELIDRSGLKKNFIADSLGISFQALTNKLQGKSDFTRGEVEILCDLLRISDPTKVVIIFFPKWLNKIQPR